MKTLGIFGSTGVTGLLLTEYALNEGHTVYALARTPSKLQLPGADAERLANLHVVQGDINDSRAVEEVVSHADVVLETLGASVNRKTTIKQDGARAIIAAMKKHHKTRFIALTSHACSKIAIEHMPWIQRKLVGVLLGHIQEDLLTMERVIEAEAGWLDYTVLRPPALLPVPPTRQCMFSTDSMPEGTRRVPFADVALVMLESAEQHTFSKQLVFMDNPIKLKIGFKDLEKQRALVWDNLWTKVLVPGAQIGAVVAAVLLARWTASKQLGSA